MNWFFLSLDRVSEWRLTGNFSMSSCWALPLCSSSQPFRQWETFKYDNDLQIIGSLLVTSKCSFHFVKCKWERTCNQVFLRGGFSVFMGGSDCLINIFDPMSLRLLGATLPNKEYWKTEKVGVCFAKWKPVYYCLAAKSANMMMHLT